MRLHMDGVTGTSWPPVGTWPLPEPSVPTVTVSGTVWPSATCLGNVHVWACGHTTLCQCGAATRTVPVCPECGR